MERKEPSNGLGSMQIWARINFWEEIQGLRLAIGPGAAWWGGTLQLCGPVGGHTKPRKDKQGFGSHKSLRCHLRLKGILPVQEPAANLSLRDTEHPGSRMFLPGTVSWHGPITTSAFGAVSQGEVHQKSGLWASGSSGGLGSSVQALCRAHFLLRAHCEC